MMMMMAGQYKRSSEAKTKNSVIYTALLPDGTAVEKKSYNVNTTLAFLGCYQHQGRWYISGIVTEPKDWGSQTFVEAKRK